MADHPMQCYPGQFEPWRPNSHILSMAYLDPEEFSNDYDGLERYGVSHAQIILHSQTAINRMMSGQIITVNSKT